MSTTSSPVAVCRRIYALLDGEGARRVGGRRNSPRHEEIRESLRPLLRLNRGMLGLEKIEHGLLRSLERDPPRVDRVSRLLTIPGIGPVTALSWVLEVGEVKRFASVKQVISYSGLCAD